ncbi:MAG: Maf family nucleotide pyrophosphatase [Saprospiraceae bacterium]|nr:septum formation protein Maf [Saprospiraceae bacterium]MCB9343639.1 septum formation protein Maf [Lewinellaceae bacterium]
MRALQRPIILASKSPRRSQLLREAGFTFTVQAFDVDESFSSEMPLEEVAPYLAQKKAQAAKHLIQDQEIILTADSTVILGDTIFNKPEDYAEAQSMLRALSGKQHTVVTGVCLLGKEKEVVLSGHTQVWFSELSDEEIDHYIRHYAPFDKAGSYGAQDWIGHCKIPKIEGSFQNVMGLPVALVYEALSQF